MGPTTRTTSQVALTGSLDNSVYQKPAELLLEMKLRCAGAEGPAPHYAAVRENSLRGNRHQKQGGHGPPRARSGSKFFASTISFNHGTTSVVLTSRSRHWSAEMGVRRRGGAHGGPGTSKAGAESQPATHEGGWGARHTDDGGGPAQFLPGPLPRSGFLSPRTASGWNGHRGARRKTPEEASAAEEGARSTSLSDAEEGAPAGDEGCSPRGAQGCSGRGTGTGAGGRGRAGRPGKPGSRQTDAASRVPWDLAPAPSPKAPPAAGTSDLPFEPRSGASGAARRPRPPPPGTRHQARGAGQRRSPRSSRRRDGAGGTCGEAGPRGLRGGRSERARKSGGAAGPGEERPCREPPLGAGSALSGVPGEPVLSEPLRGPPPPAPFMGSSGPASRTTNRSASGRRVTAPHSQWRQAQRSLYFQLG